MENRYKSKIEVGWMKGHHHLWNAVKKPKSNKIIIIHLNSFIICIATIRQSHKKERKILFVIIIIISYMSDYSYILKSLVKIKFICFKFNFSAYVFMLF